MTAGAGLCHRDIVDLVVREGPERVRELIALGTHFSLRPGTEEPEYDLGREGGHSHRRILHASDATGREIMRALVEAVRREPNITVLERHLAVDLLVDAKFDAIDRAAPSCWGAYVLRSRHRRRCDAVARAPRCWPPAAPARCTSTPAIPTSRPATASPWRIAPACRSATWSSSSFTRPASTIRRRSRS